MYGKILLKIFRVDVKIAGVTLAKVNKIVLLPTNIFITSHCLTVFFFSSTILCVFWLAQLFISISSSPASFLSNYSLQSSSSHSSHRPPILLLAFPSVLLHTVYICIWSQPLFHQSFFLHAPQPAQSFVCYISYYIFVINCFFQFLICFESPQSTQTE